MEDSVFRNLNRNQLEAATQHLDKPLIIFAGPGSGKTLTLALRIVFLLNKHAAPQGLLALTFTKKAAAEMKKRLERYLPRHSRVEDIGVHTFHRFCLKVLRAHACKARLSYDFSIVSGMKQQKLLEEAVQKYLKDSQLVDLWKGETQPLSEEQFAVVTDDCVEPIFPRDSPGTLKSIFGVISKAKLEKSFQAGLSPSFKRLLALYNAELREHNTVDLPDILSLAVQLLKEYPQVLSKYQVKYLFIDEFQDTNPVQLELVSLVGSSALVTVCGDDDQAIYGWRGASSSVFQDFARSFPAAQRVTLAQNYRSTQHIVRVSQSLITANTLRVAKSLFTDNQMGPKVELLISESTRGEARDIAKLVLQYRELHQLEFKDIAILYRLHQVSKEIRHSLEELAIPMTFNKKKTLLEFDPTAKAVLAYVKLAVDPNHDSALLEVLNWPRRGLGKAAVELLKKTACVKECSLHVALKSLSRTAPKRQRAQFTEFLLSIDHFHSHLPGSTASSLLSLISSRFSLKPPSISGLLSLAKGHSSPGKQSLQLFLSSFSSDFETPCNSVQLCTIHHSKGLEWRLVFIVGLVEGVLPSTRAEDLEEERRLTYVAVTRCKEFLVLASAQCDSTGQFQCPSRFLEEFCAESLAHLSVVLPHRKVLKL